MRCRFVGAGAPPVLSSRHVLFGGCGFVCRSACLRASRVGPWAEERPRLWRHVRQGRGSCRRTTKRRLAVLVAVADHAASAESPCSLSAARFGTPGRFASPSEQRLGPQICPGCPLRWGATGNWRVPEDRRLGPCCARFRPVAAQPLCPSQTPAAFVRRYTGSAAGAMADATDHRSLATGCGHAARQRRPPPSPLLPHRAGLRWAWAMFPSSEHAHEPGRGNEGQSGGEMASSGNGQNAGSAGLFLWQW